MASSNNRHVVPNPKGGWDVKAPGAKRASAHAPTQAQAERRASRRPATWWALRSSGGSTT